MRFLAFFIFISLSFFGVLAQDMERVRATIDTLCAPGMHGRGAVNDGEKKAAAFLSQQFKEIGLQPFGDTYYQYYNFSINTFPKKVYLRQGKQVLSLGKAYIVDAISEKGRGKKKVVVVDSLTIYDPIKRTAFMGMKTKNKVCVYESKFYNDLVDQPELFEKVYAAKAIIELENKKLTASLSSSQHSQPFFHVLKDSFNLEAKKIKFRVDAELIENYRSQNVIGYVKGSEKPNEMVVVTAHYDHLGRMGSVYFPGANDNASGVAMLLELARHYSQSENRPEKTIVFMAFGSEEAGLVGSKYYTENPLFPIDNIKFLLNLDLLGTGEQGITVVNGTLFEEELKQLTAINTKEDCVPKVKVRGPAANSDHFFFTQMGVHAFFVYAMGDYHYYHDVYDKAAAVSLSKFSELFKLFRTFINVL